MLGVVGHHAVGKDKAQPVRLAKQTNSATIGHAFVGQLKTPMNAVLGAYKFYVLVSTAGGINASVGGTLGISSFAYSGGNSNNQFLTYTASISPSTVTLGINGSANFQLYLTNTGNVADFLTLFPSPDAPANMGLTYTPSPYPYLLPGLNSTVTVTGTITTPPYFYNFAPGTYHISLPVDYYPTTTLLVPLTVVVVSSGVTGYITPNPGTTNDNFVLNLSNVGAAQDTFDLSVIGPLSQSASVPRHLRADGRDFQRAGAHHTGAGDIRRARQLPASDQSCLAQQSIGPGDHFHHGTGGWVEECDRDHRPVSGDCPDYSRGGGAAAPRQQYRQCERYLYRQHHQYNGSGNGNPGWIRAILRTTCVGELGVPLDRAGDRSGSGVPSP